MSEARYPGEPGSLADRQRRQWAAQDADEMLAAARARALATATASSASMEVTFRVPAPLDSTARAELVLAIGLTAAALWSVDPADIRVELRIDEPTKGAVNGT